MVPARVGPRGVGAEDEYAHREDHVRIIMAGKSVDGHSRTLGTCQHNRLAFGRTRAQNRFSMLRSIPILTTLVLCLALAGAVSAARLPAQCADGSPPPCGRPAARPAPPAASSVAVLYFEARDTVDAYLADGLTEDLTSLLGSVPRVQVKSPGVVRRAQRASPGDAPAIARALGVRYLVDGNVRRIGTRVRVAALLVNCATAVAAGGAVFDRTPGELLGLTSG